MEHFNALKKYLSTLASVPPTQWLNLVSKLSLRRLPKDSFYYTQGEMFDEIGFITTGLTYNFYTDAEGTEFVKNFSYEGQMVTCYSDLIRGAPASFSCRVLEPTWVLTLKYKDLQKLYSQHTCWERMGRLSAERLFAEKEVREREFLLMDAKARYEQFVKEHRAIVDRVPQYLIASHIGVSPVSLSRIRGTYASATKEMNL